MFPFESCKIFTNGIFTEHLWATVFSQIVQKTASHDAFTQKTNQFSYRLNTYLFKLTTVTYETECIRNL